MFFAHIPAGYLVSRALVRGNPFPLKFVLFAGMAGGMLPDIDLLYLYLLDSTPQHHHTYWTHLPIDWLGCTVLAWVAARKCSAAFRLGLAAFLLGWLSHLLLDTLTGDIWWLYPLVDQPYSLVKIEARYQPWWMNYLLHWSMAVEAAIIALAVWLEGTKPRVLPHPEADRFPACYARLETDVLSKPQSVDGAAISRRGARDTPRSQYPPGLAGLS